MAATIPTKEPLTIRAGDSIEWTKSIDDYKASDQLDAEIGALLCLQSVPATTRTGYLRLVNPNAALPKMVIRERIISQIHPVDPIDGPSRLPQLLLIHFTNGLAGQGD